jgi:hypothetical protein
MTQRCAMRLQITEAGRAKVETLAFAEKIRTFIEEIKETGGNEETQNELIVYVVAKTLTETEDVPVDTEELEEFTQLHASEIDTAIDNCLDMLLVQDLLEDTEEQDHQ